MTANKLQLNDNKTEAMIIISNRMSVHSPLPSVIHIGDADVPFVSSVKNLGVTLDSNLSMSQHISNTCKAAYIQIRHVSSIWHLLTNYLLQFHLWNSPSVSVWSCSTLYSRKTITICIWHTNLCHPPRKHKNIWWKIFFLCWPICLEQFASNTPALWFYLLFQSRPQDAPV